MNKGCFITFEGGEGSGKTTLIHSLKKELEGRGYSVLLTREPGGTKLGEEIRVLLLHKNKEALFSSRAELFLFLASRAQHVEEVILPALKQGKIVLCDRFSDSSIIYQGHARGLGIEKISELCLFATQDLQPDLTFYLDVDPKLGFERVKSRKYDRIESEDFSFHEKIRKGYLLLAEKQKRIHVLDAQKDSKNVFIQAKEWIDKAFAKLGLLCPSKTS
jgi:dTMP kinase